MDGPICFAITELSKYLGRIAGAPVPAGNSKRTAVIVVGLRSELSAEDQASLPAAAAGFDGYAVSVTGGSDVTSARIVIGADNERAAIYAVYDLLERMGCRWFYPTLDAKDPEVIPQRDDARLETGKWSLASPFRDRVFCWCSGAEFVPDDLARLYDWAVKCRFNTVGNLFPAEATRRGLRLSAGGHNFGEFLKTEDYFEKHPEWFGMQNGKRQPHQFGGSQFCWSNPEARETFVENAVRYLSSQNDLDLYGLYGGDGMPACTCPECEKLEASDWQMLILNAVMERMEKIRPELRIITAGAYAPVVEPPRKYRPHPKMLVSWAHWGRHHGMSFSDETYDWKPNLDRWFEIYEGRIVPFQYYSDHFAEPWVAPPYATTIEGDRKYLIEHKAYGFTNLMYPSAYWWNWGLNNYLAGRAFHDASFDPMAAIRDYAMHYYGSAAGPLIAAYYEEWALNLDLAYLVRDGATAKEAITLADMRARCIEPALAAVKHDPTLFYRVGKVEKIHEMAECLAEIHCLRGEIAALRTKGEFEQAGERIAAARQCVDRTEQYIQSLIDLQQGLADPELLSHFYPRIRAAIEQEAELVAKRSSETFGKQEVRPEDMVPEH